MDDDIAEFTNKTDLEKSIRFIETGAGFMLLVSASSLMYLFEPFLNSMYPGSKTDYLAEPWMLADAIFVLTVAILMLRKSLIACILALIYFVCRIIVVNEFEIPGAYRIVHAIIFSFLLYKACQGAYVYRKAAKQPRVNRRSSFNVILLLFAGLLVILTIIYCWIILEKNDKKNRI